MYEIVQHTADVRMHVRARTREELFADAVRGLMEIIGGQASGAPQSRLLHIESPDLTSLLVDLLNEVLTRCHIDRTTVTRIDIRSLSDTAIDVELGVQAVDTFEEDVKAVTYHEADVRRSDGGWSTTLVFDI